jgi:hypothetical protein
VQSRTDWIRKQADVDGLRLSFIRADVGIDERTRLGPHAGWQVRDVER